MKVRFGITSPCIAHVSLRKPKNLAHRDRIIRDVALLLHHIHDALPVERNLCCLLHVSLSPSTLCVAVGGGTTGGSAHYKQRKTRACFVHTRATIVWLTARHANAAWQAFMELQLKRYCCRRMLMTHVDLIEKLMDYAPLEQYSSME